MTIIKSVNKKSKFQNSIESVSNQEILRLVNLVKNENNLVARDIIFFNFFEDITSLLKIKLFQSYYWISLSKEELETIAFLAINSGIATFTETKNVPFNYYIKLHSIIFFVRYICRLSTENKQIKLIEKEEKARFKLEDNMSLNPHQQATWIFFVEKMQKIIGKLLKRERNALLLRLEGYGYTQIYKLLGVRQHRLRYIIENIREQFIKLGFTEINEI